MNGVFFQGLLWLLLGLQLYGSSGGSDEEENWLLGPPEPTEPAGLQHQ